MSIPTIYIPTLQKYRAIRPTFINLSSPWWITDNRVVKTSHFSWWKFLNEIYILISLCKRDTDFFPYQFKHTYSILQFYSVVRFRDNIYSQIIYKIPTLLIFCLLHYSDANGLLRLNKSYNFIFHSFSPMFQ